MIVVCSDSNSGSRTGHSALTLEELVGFPVRWRGISIMLGGAMTPMCYGHLLPQPWKVSVGLATLPWYIGKVIGLRGITSSLMQTYTIYLDI